MTIRETVVKRHILSKNRSPRKGIKRLSNRRVPLAPPFRLVAKSCNDAPDAVTSRAQLDVAIQWPIQCQSGRHLGTNQRSAHVQQAATEVICKYRLALSKTVSPMTGCVSRCAAVQPGRKLVSTTLPDGGRSSHQPCGWY